MKHQSDTYRSKEGTMKGGFWRRFFWVLLLLITACGVGSSGGGSNSSSENPSGTGAVTFAVKWEPPPEAIVPGGAALLSPRPMASVIDVCTDYGIDTVTVRVLKGTDVLATQAFPCALHSGTIYGIPAGENLVVAIAASIGEVTPWNGQSTPFTLAAGTTHDAGKIDMVYSGTDHTAPSVASVNPSDNSFNVPENADIRVRFNERMAANTVIDNNAIQVLPEGGSSVPGNLSYNLSDNSAVFHPSASLQSGTKHSVTVASSVKDMAGNAMGSAYSSAFHTRFRGQWGIPAQIESDKYDTGNGGGPYLDVALNDQGDAFAVWQETQLTPMFTYASRYNSAINQWETSTNISPSTANYAWSARVVADNNGNAIAVWIQEYEYVVANRYSGGSWTGAVTFNDPKVQGGNDTYISPMIAMDKTTGNACISYVGVINHLGKIYVSCYSPASGQWNLNYYSAGDNCSGKIKTHKIAMKQGAKNHLLLYSCDDGKIYVDGVPPTQIGTGETIDVASRNLRVVVVWDNASGLWSSFYDGQGQGWGNPVLISNSGSHPSVAMNDNGDIIALWGGGSDNVYASHTTFAGKLWSTPINLSGTPPYPGSVSYAKLGMDKDGNAMAVWRQSQAADRIVVSKRYDSTTKTWNTSTENISKNASSRADYPTFSMNETGNAIAMWLLWPVGSSYPNAHANFWYK